MESTPIRALDKVTRAGRRAIIDLVPAPGPAAETKYWMRCEIGGEVYGKRYLASVQRNASSVPGLPHAISTGIPYQAVIGLTDEEANAIDAAMEEWHGRHLRERLQAAPDAPTRVLRNKPHPVPPRPGKIIEDEQGCPVVVLELLQEQYTEDGWSMGIMAEDGWLYTTRVRELTAAEEHARQSARDEKETVFAAFEEAETIFGWAPDLLRETAPDDATLLDEGPLLNQCRYLFVRRGTLWRDDERDCYVTQVSTAPGYLNGFVEHPATPERDRVWAVLDAARDGQRVYYPELYL